MQLQERSEFIENACPAQYAVEKIKYINSTVTVYGACFLYFSFRWVFFQEVSPGFSSEAAAYPVPHQTLYGSSTFSSSNHRNPTQGTDVHVTIH